MANRFHQYERWLQVHLKLWMLDRAYPISIMSFLPPVQMVCSETKIELTSCCDVPLHFSIKNLLEPGFTDALTVQFRSKALKMETDVLLSSEKQRSWNLSKQRFHCQGDMDITNFKQPIVYNAVQHANVCFTEIPCGWPVYHEYSPEELNKDGWRRVIQYSIRGYWT